MTDLSFKYKELINELKNSSPFIPDLGLILGSGLGDFVNSINIIKSISTKDLPYYPPSTIPGHAGYIHFAEYKGKNLLLFQGRIHFYEGYKISECILPVFISFKLNCKNLLITNAAGGINYNFNPGDLMLALSFNGINIKKELTDLIGLASETGKNNFLNFPSMDLNSIIKKAALEEKIELKEGIYWFNKGPSYETPAEIKMAEKFGGDAVGMSTLHEAVFSAFLGINTSVVSVITNYAAGILKQKLAHSDVTETANLIREKFERLIKKIIQIL